MSLLVKPVYRFGRFELEPDERRLSEAGNPIALTPKVFNTLVLLVERAGHVVSKDELMKALWPRGYVDESNLTKHIWLIRRALGGGEDDSRFIETVPKIGYRFVAPVAVGSASPAGTGASVSPPAPVEGVAVPSRRDGFLRWIRVALAGLAAALLVFAVGWRLAGGPAAMLPAMRHGRTVALVGFSNLSQNPKDAWLAPALREMLGTELSVSGNVQVLPDELVRDASADLTAPAGGGYSPAALARLRQRLDADYAISGSYLVIGSADDARLRVDIALQDARTGALVTSVSNQSGVSDLIALVTRTGATLRNRLGIRTPDADTLGRIANSRPPNLDVARRLGFALDALHHYDAARARDELLEAVAEAPGYAPAYAYLAEAWSALGYRDKALAAAEQAAQNSAGLPPEQRLQAAAVVDGAHAEWSKAAAAWQALVRRRPASVDYRLQAIDAQIAAGGLAGAQRALRKLARACRRPPATRASSSPRRAWPRRLMMPAAARSMPRTP